MITRDEVYNAIDGERNYQDALGPKRTDDSDKSVGDYLIMMDTYFRKAKDGWTDHPGTGHSLAQIRKIAAICVRCMEEHGAVTREQEGMMSISASIKQNEELIKQVANN